MMRFGRAAANLSMAILALAIPVATEATAIAAEPGGASSQDEGQKRESAAEAAGARGYEAYAQGDYAKAISAYTESYQLSPTGEALFNIANIYDKKLNDAKLAVEFYRRYNAAPDATPELIARSTQRIAALSSASQPSASTGSESRDHAAPDASPKSGSTELRVLGIGLGVLGLVGVGVGTAFGLNAKSRHDAAQAAGCSGSACPDAASASKERDAASAGTVSTVGFIAGGVLLAGGITLFVVASNNSGANNASSAGHLRISPTAGSNGGGLSLSGAFF